MDMNKTAQKTQERNRRHARIRARVVGTAARPRLSVFRSNRYLYAQLINDETNTTLASVDTRKLKGDSTGAKASEAGKVIAEAAKKLKIEAVVFDRGGFKYQGGIAALADGAREGGLSF